MMHNVQYIDDLGLIPLDCINKLNSVCCYLEVPLKLFRMQMDRWRTRTNNNSPGRVAADKRNFPSLGEEKE